MAQRFPARGLCGSKARPAEKVKEEGGEHAAEESDQQPDIEHLQLALAHPLRSSRKQQLGQTVHCNTLGPKRPFAKRIVSIARAHARLIQETLQAVGG